jgi:hypothetical protein
MLPYGGTVDEWNLEGDPGEIYYNEVNGNSVVTFQDASPGTFLSQHINGSNFNIGDSYRISFNISNYSGRGSLTLGLFNNVGHGFTFTEINGDGQFSFIGVIDTVSDDWTSMHNQLFLIVENPDNFSANIDNVKLEQVGGGKTITFSEDVKGWTSFKSFVPEFGISVVNQYYTMNKGMLYKHHVEEDTFNNVVDRNTFYGDFKYSSVTPILNMQPETVKNFNTLNYEGSQSKIKQFTTDAATGLTDGEYYNLEAKLGWYVETIHTDKQSGTLNEFIEKEGKWFNYIKGHPGQVDLPAFNTQGLGEIMNDPSQI